MSNSKRTYIELSGLRLTGYHGVLPQENLVGNVFEFYVKLFFDASSAMAYDDFRSTVDYSKVVEIIKHENNRPSQLIEHLAHRVRHSIEEEYPQVDGGEIKVSKLAPPIACQMDAATFCVAW